jgi:DNA-binding transcriptional MerR regulator
MKSLEVFPSILLIGQFSKLSGLSCRMLRFYAEQNILVPAFTDPATGYRHYLASQLTEAKLLRHLRQADFSLDDIAAVLNGLETAQWEGCIAAQRGSIAQKIASLEMALEELERIEKHRGPEDCVLARVLPMRVLSAPLAGERMRLREMARSEVKRLCGSNGGSGPLFCFYDLRTGPVRATLCIPTEEPAGEILPGGLLAASLHRGPYEAIPATLERLLAWVKQNKYTTNGRVLECYFPCGEEERPHGRVEIAVSLDEAALAAR